MRRLALAAAALLAAAAPLAAHPHVIVQPRLAVQCADGRPASLRFDWTFDESFSASILQEVGAPPAGGLFDPAAQKAIHAGFFQNLREYGYFLRIFVDDKRFRVAAVRDFQASAAGKRVSYRFVVDLPPPAKPGRHSLRVVCFDDSFFVAFDPWAPAAVAVAGETPPDWTLGLAPVKLDAGAWGAIAAQECRIAFTGK